MLMGIASLNTILRVSCLPEGVADLVRDGPEPPARFADEIRSYAAPLAPFHVGARPARDFAGRARSYRLPGGTVFLPP
ncbi:hypothetical protein Pssp01_01810 [Pseudomonas sp. NBRC 100443]|nr:hypothetical protein Pssp01_01810 [Pseudomonas sp. NBRC 100443]